MCCLNSFHSVPPNYTSPGPQTITEGDTNTQINVTTDANPFPSSFTWSRNGVPITSSSNVALTESSIRFTTVQRNNAGMYNVYSNNTAGGGSTTFELIVQCKLFSVDILATPRHVLRPHKTYTQHSKTCLKN